MDGQRRSNPLFERCRAKPPGLIDATNRQILRVLLAVSLAATCQPGLAADWFRPFHRTSPRTKEYVEAKAAAQPPAKLESVSTATPISGEFPVRIEAEPADSPETDVREHTAHLRRFPGKSTRDLEKASLFEDDLATDVEQTSPIDLPTALELAGWRSPAVLIAQQRVLAVTAQQQLAAAQALPNLNLGTNYDDHGGALQNADGRILTVQRSALYAGAGANAVAAGTVNIPGLAYNLNVGETYFNFLASRQRSEGAHAAAGKIQNNVLLATASAYCRLVQAQGARAIAVEVRNDAEELARITAAFAKAGQGRPADAERAATELALRDIDVLTADATIVEISARLGEILNLETSIGLRSGENWMVPRSIVPDLIPLPELIAIALYQRPEVAEYRAGIHAAMLELDSARLLLFSPQVIAGFSDGAFGGGSNFNHAATGKPRFGSFDNRTDVDVIMYWSVRNLGLANRALIKAATARLAMTDLEQTQQFNEIRAQVADAYARTQSLAAQLDVRQRAVISSQDGFRADLLRTRSGEGRPIEALDSLRLLSRAQLDYLQTIAGYNLAHYELYVTIGQPPADLLVRFADEGIPPALPEEPK